MRCASFGMQLVLQFLPVVSPSWSFHDAMFLMINNTLAPIVARCPENRHATLPNADCVFSFFMDRFAHHGLSMWEVGSCDGAQAVYAARHGYAVTVFEPSPHNRKIMETLASTKAKGLVKVEAKAVSSELGTVSFYEQARTFSDTDNGRDTTKPRGCGPDAHLRNEGETQERAAARHLVKVNVTTLTAYHKQLQEERKHQRLQAASHPCSAPFYLKVDVQGYEPLVFLGAEQMLRRCPIYFIQFEFWPSAIRSRTQTNPTVIFQLLASLGYDLYSLGYQGKVNTASDKYQLATTYNLEDSNASLADRTGQFCHRKGYKHSLTMGCSQDLLAVHSSAASLNFDLHRDLNAWQEKQRSTN